MDAIVLGPNPINIISEHIEVGDGFKVLFDLEDMEKVARHKWVPFHNGNYCPFGCREHIYPVVQKTDKTRIRAHKVMDFTPNNGMTIDHINKNSLDNRKANLRIATKAIQSINQNLQRK
jgi:hypothetical protein